PDHPVRAVEAAFGIFFSMAQPPLLSRRGAALNRNGLPDGAATLPAGGESRGPERLPSWIGGVARSAGVVTERRCRLPDHPVRAVEVAFGIFLLMAQPPS